MSVKVSQRDLGSKVRDMFSKIATNIRYGPESAVNRYKGKVPYEVKTHIFTMASSTLAGGGIGYGVERLTGRLEGKWENLDFWLVGALVGFCAGAILVSYVDSRLYHARHRLRLDGLYKKVDKEL